MKNTENMRVGIRADGNSVIGMGHLMRCISIVKALEKQAVECVFITAEKGAGAFLEEREFDVRILETDYQDMESELPILKKIMAEEGFSLLLVDSYQMTGNYLNELMNFCPVFYLDDMGVSCLKADGIINYNIYGTELGYESWCPKETKLLLGAGYAPVKEQFSETPYEVRDVASQILLTMGGSDALNIAGRLGEKLLGVLPKEIELEIICGRFNPHLETLLQMQEADRRVHISVDVQDMWNKMAATDIVVSAAGSTLYELSTMGVPTVCCYYVENQRRIAEGFAEKVQMINGGDFSADSQAVLEKLTEEVMGLVDSLEARRSLSRQMKQVTDGHGAEHIAKELIKYNNLQKELRTIKQV